MKRFLKKLAFGLLEIGSYIILNEPVKHIGISSFFGFWAIISLVLPVFIFFTKSTSFYSTDVMHYQNVNFVRNPEDMAHSTGIKDMCKKTNNKRIIVKCSVYIMFLIYFLVNVIGYILTSYLFT